MPVPGGTLGAGGEGERVIVLPSTMAQLPNPPRKPEIPTILNPGICAKNRKYKLVCLFLDSGPFHFYNRDKQKHLLHASGRGRQIDKDE